MRRSIYPNGSGGGSGDFVSLTTFNTYAELDAQAAEDGNLGLVASGTAGQPRLFRYATDTWIPDEPVVWTIATTGAGVMTGLIDAAGEAVYPGDLGTDGNGTVYYAVGAAGRCVFVPRSLTGGVILGETHTAALVALLDRESVADSDDAFVERTGAGGGAVTFDSGTGRITITGGTGSGNSTGVGLSDSLAPDADVLCFGLLGAAFSGTDSFFQAYRDGGVSDPDQIRVFARVATDKYEFSFGTNPDTSVDVSEPTDSLVTVEGSILTSTARLYVDSPAPATDDAVPAAGITEMVVLSTNAPATDTGVLILALPSGVITLDGAFLVSLTAV